jgi:isopentenyl-diphosphate delta-isomerase
MPHTKTEFATLQVTQRKQEHIDAVLHDPLVERKQGGFDQIRLTHRGLPECDFSQVDTTSQFLGKTISFPFMIGSMTGGSTANLGSINRHLAEAAEICQVPMAVGSQRAMILEDAAKQSFTYVNMLQASHSLPI